jgi:hypothetical protein
MDSKLLIIDELINFSEYFTHPGFNFNQPSHPSFVAGQVIISGMSNVRGSEVYLVFADSPSYMQLLE